MFTMDWRNISFNSVTNPGLDIFYKEFNYIEKFNIILNNMADHPLDFRDIFGSMIS